MKIKNISILFYTIVFLSNNAFSENYRIVSKGLVNVDKMIIEKKDLFISNGIIVEENERINYKLIDKKELYIMPGLIDTHILTFLEDKSHGTNLSSEMIRNLNNKDRYKNGIKNLKELLRSGFTTVRDLGNCGIDLCFKVKQTSSIPEYITSGPGVVFEKGQFSKDVGKNIVTKEYVVIEKVEDIKKIIIDRKKRGIKWIKIYADNEPEEYIVPKQKLIQLVKTIKESGLKVAAHAIYEKAIVNAMMAGVDSIQHAINVNPKTPYVDFEGFFIPTDFSNRQHEKIAKILRREPEGSATFHRNLYKQRFKYIEKYGMKMAFGSDSYVEFTWLKNAGQRSLESLFSLKESGLENTTIIKMITKNAAELLQEKIGNIKVGYRANIVGLSKNPIEDIYALKNISFVMKQGKIIK